MSGNESADQGVGSLTGTELRSSNTAEHYNDLSALATVRLSRRFGLTWSTAALVATLAGIGGAR